MTKTMLRRMMTKVFQVPLIETPAFKAAVQVGDATYFKTKAVEEIMSGGSIQKAVIYLMVAICKQG